MSTSLKTCKTCELELPLEAFERGRNSCKSCTKNRKRLEYQLKKARRVTSTSSTTSSEVSSAAEDEDTPEEPASPSSDETHEEDSRLDSIMRDQAIMKESIKHLQRNEPSEEMKAELFNLKSSMAELRNDSNALSASLDEATAKVHKLILGIETVYQERLDKLEAVVNLFERYMLTGSS